MTTFQVSKTIQISTEINTESVVLKEALTASIGKYYRLSQDLSWSKDARNGFEEKLQAAQTLLAQI